jgi:IclR family transcriptional regulator, acetate operon repressor
MGEKSSVLKAIGLLRHVAHSDEPQTLADVSRALGLPKATAHRLADHLERAELIHKDPLTRRYEIAAAFEQLALTVIRNGGGHTGRRLHMQRLSEKIGERINLGVLSGGKLLYVEWVESAWPLRVDFQPGAQVPVHASANGKLLIAHASEAVRRQIVQATPLPRYTRNTITTARGLLREFERIKERGYSQDNEEYMAGVCCLAVPVKTSTGGVVAGLAVMAPSARLSLDKARTHLPDLQACAAAISLEFERLRAEREPAERYPRQPKRRKTQ